MSKDQLKLDEWDIVKWLTVVSDDYCMERCLEAAEEIKRLRAREARLQKALEKIIHEDLWTTKHPDGVTQRGESVFDGYFGGIARAALEEEKK
jgi:hypothetical protein